MQKIHSLYRLLMSVCTNQSVGHAASWCTGYPEICPSPSCLQPLDPSSNLTFPLITSLLSECTGAAPTVKPFAMRANSKQGKAQVRAKQAKQDVRALQAAAPAVTSDEALFPYSLLHLGGDEVSYTCWDQAPQVQAWETANGIDGSEGTYEYFVDRVATIARDQQRTPVQWVEVFEHFGRYSIYCMFIIRNILCNGIHSRDVLYICYVLMPADVPK